MDNDKNYKHVQGLCCRECEEDTEILYDELHAIVWNVCFLVKYSKRQWFAIQNLISETLSYGRFPGMNGAIIAKDVHGITIDYLIEINGTICFLGYYNQPIEEFLSAIM